MKLFKAVLLTTFILATACDSFGVSLGGIKGKVLNSITGKPIEGVYIQATAESNLENEQKYLRVNTKTDRSGSFVIKGIRGKMYILTISIPQGYRGPIALHNNPYYFGATVPKESNALVDDIKLHPIPTNFEVKNGAYGAKVVVDKKNKRLWLEDQTRTYQRLDNYIDTWNSRNVFGHKDWRLPTTEEAKQFCQEIALTLRAYNGAERYNADPKEFFGSMGISDRLEFTITSDDPERIGEKYYKNWPRVNFYGGQGHCDSAGESMEGTPRSWLTTDSDSIQ